MSKHLTQTQLDELTKFIADPVHSSYPSGLFTTIYFEDNDYFNHLSLAACNGDHNLRDSITCILCLLILEAEGE